MTSEDPDRIAARIRRGMPVLADQLESLAADLRLLSDSLTAQRQRPPAPEASDRKPSAAPRPAAPVPEPEPVRVRSAVDDVAVDDLVPPPPRAGLPRFFAVAGSAVALVGVALVLWLPSGSAIGAQLGRTAVGLALAALAVGAAVWQHRVDPANVGARALLATGIVSTFLCLLAVTVRFTDADDVPLLAGTPGLVLTAVVGVAGLWTARSWRSQGVAVVVVLAGLLVAVLIGEGRAGSPLAVVAGMVLMTLVAGAVQLGRGWVWLLLARTAPTVLYIIWVAASPSIFRWGPGLTPATATGIAVLLTAVLALGSLALAVVDRSWNWQERVVEGGGLAALSTPLLVISQTQEIEASSALGCLVVGAVFVAAILVLRRHVPEAVQETALPLGVLYLVLGALVAADRQFLAYLPWGLAAVTLALAQRSRSRPPLVAGSILGVVGLVWWLPVLPVLLDASFVEDVADHGVERVVQSLLGLAVALFGYRSYRAFFPARRIRVLDIAWSGAVVIGAAAVVLLGSLLGSWAGDLVRGFQVAHVLVTIGMGALCVVLVSPRLQAGREHRARARLAAGLAVAAVVKLVLFDTQALPAPWRATVFLMVGVLLLVVGTWYYRQLEPGRRTTTRRGSESGGTDR